MLNMYFLVVRVHKIDFLRAVSFIIRRAREFPLQIIFSFEFWAESGAE